MNSWMAPAERGSSTAMRAGFPGVQAKAIDCRASGCPEDSGCALLFAGGGPVAHQGIPADACGVQGARLHMAKALDLLRIAGDLDRQLMIDRRQLRQHLFDAG